MSLYVSYISLLFGLVSEGVGVEWEGRDCVARYNVT